MGGEGRGKRVPSTITPLESTKLWKAHICSANGGGRAGRKGKESNHPGDGHFAVKGRKSVGRSVLVRVSVMCSLVLMVESECGASY